MPIFTTIQYVPSPVPDNALDLNWWLANELELIANVLNTQNVIIGITGSGTATIDTTENEAVIGIGDLPSIEIPDVESFDSATGVWTCSADGIYTVSSNCILQGFGSGNKNYLAYLSCEVNGVEKIKSEQSAQDDFPLAIVLTAPLVLLRGDKVTVKIGTLHELFSGTTPYTYVMSYNKTTST